MTSTPKKRTCARCGNLAWPGASFPEGHLCHPCLNAALQLAGTRPGCGIPDRALIGLRDGVPVCRDCAGITREFCCLRCGTETGMANGNRRELKRLGRRAGGARRRAPRGSAAALTRRLGALDGHPHLRLLRQFGQWHQLPAMRARAADGPLAPTACQYAKSCFTQAQAFLTWTLAAGVRPPALTQAHIDAYYNTCRAYQRLPVRAFLTWAAEHGHVPARLDIPRQKHPPGQAITQKRRLELLRRFTTDAGIPLRPRAAACIMLLYAQPLTRILRLTAHDLTRDDDARTWLNLGDPPSPVPPPGDELLRQLAATRCDHVPANHASTWLFPGRQAGQPAEYQSMARQLRDHGLPMRTGRIAALRQLVLQVPAPVIADALGFHHTTTTRQHVNAGVPWSHYAGGNHPTQ